MPSETSKFDKIRELLEVVYPISRDATIYAEVVTGEMNYKGMGELRDVLEHLHRALSVDDEECALDNITEAYEHLRRAGVESVQRAATKLYWDCLECMKTPSILYKLAFLDVPDIGKVRELRMNAMRKIADGRKHKSSRDTWAEAIEDYSEAIEYCFELRDMFPSTKDAKYRVFGLVGIIIGILSLALNVILIF
jgi:hypothetical protein